MNDALRKMMADPEFRAAAGTARENLSNILGRRTTRKLVGSKRAVRKAIRKAAKARGF